MTYLGGINWAQIGGDLGNTALVKAADAAVAVPAVRINRARIAVVVDLGYGAADRYTQAKPALFVGGIIGAILSAGALAKRRKVPEAVALYAITGLVSAAVAWFTRPGTTAAPPESNPQSPGVVKSTLQWADARVASRTQQDPGWEPRALARLMNDFGTGTMAPAIQTLLTKNGH